MEMEMEMKRRTGAEERGEKRGNGVKGYRCAIHCRAHRIEASIPPPNGMGGEVQESQSPPPAVSISISIPYFHIQETKGQINGTEQYTPPLDPVAALKIVSDRTRLAWTRLCSFHLLYSKEEQMKTKRD